ncbi:subtilisin-like protein [Lactarius sanguifluus]|nr:subtilisin-like protein [Lactarius sanguifluus]
MRFYSLSILSVLAPGPLSGLATPFASHWDDLRAKHTWNSVPENWRNLGHPPADTTIDLHIALKAQNENALIDALIEHTCPAAPSRQGAYLSREKVAELVAPPSDVLELTNAWLEHYGVHPSSISTKHGGSWLTLTGVPVFRANELLRASYQLYQHIGTNDTILRTLSHGLPVALVEQQNVAPTTHFGFSRTLRQEPLTRRSGVTMEQTKVPGGDPGTNVLGVAGYLGDYPSPDDLRQFMNQYRSDATSATYGVVQIKGGGTGSSDTQGDGFINWLDFVLGLWIVPPTISTPYSMPEYTIPLDYATYVCSLFARLGVRGVSVLFSSGNDGVGHGDCLSRDSSGNSRVRFLPTFPSTCPWVTSVGGTTGYNPEVAASFSGGGFSAYFPRPSYQNNFVPRFLRNLGNQYNCFYNPGGRGIPDIALQAIDFRIVLNMSAWKTHGTSCSTPITDVQTAAGIISLLNDYRISNGRAPLGFLNRDVLLYGRCLEGLNDITSGSNPGCNTDGFSAVPGWDPVTGLGSLDFERLIAILSRW